MFKKVEQYIKMVVMRVVFMYKYIRFLIAKDDNRRYGYRLGALDIYYHKWELSDF